MREGVSPSWVALPPGPWASYQDFFAERFPLVSCADWGERMRLGDVVDAEGAAIDPQAAYRPHQKLWYYRALDEEQRIPFEEVVLHQDEHLLVADKPHFLPVVPTGRYLQESLLVRLKRKLGIEALSPSAPHRPRHCRPCAVLAAAGNARSLPAALSRAQGAQALRGHRALEGRASASRRSIAAI